MRIRFLVVVVGCVLLLAACGGSNNGSEAAGTSSTSTSSTTTTSTTIAPTTTKLARDEAFVEGCKILTRDDPNVYQAMNFFFLSTNEQVANAANDFRDGNAENDEQKAFNALTDLHIACKTAGLYPK